jgi:hypothetical protein
MVPRHRSNALAVLALVVIVASACAWPMDRYGPGRTGHNPFERTIGVDDVAGLEVASTGSFASFSSSRSSATVINEVVLVSDGDHRFYAFSSVGGDGCAGSPTTCAPLWTATTGGATSATAAVGNDVVYVGSDDGTLSVFSTQGTVNCSGSPKVCSPLWTATTGGGPVTSPLVVGGVVYVTSGPTLYAFDAAGEDGCSGAPATCQPLWTASVGPASPQGGAAFGDGVVFVTSWMTLHAFDAAGVTNCSAAAGTCAPLWTATPDCGGVLGCSMTSPAVAGGTVFVGSDHSDEFPGYGVLYAFDAGGQVGCSGVPRTCEPAWTADTYAPRGAPAVADGVVYVAGLRFDDFEQTTDGRLFAFDATGSTNCSGTPTECLPLWISSDVDATYGSPSVANGVVFTTSSSRLRAFDAAGCVGAPDGCAPLWTSDPLAGLISSSPVIANGRVYLGEQGALRVFALPS